MSSNRKSLSVVQRIHGTELDLHASEEQQHEDDHYTSRLTESLAKAETRSVSILRIAVISTLLLTGAIVSAGVYLYTRNEERQNFTGNFESSAHQVLESFHEMVEKHLGAVASLSTDFTSYATHSNSTFPFLTLPDFALKASHFRALSGSHIVHYFPLVTDDNRAAWEDYANRTRAHIDEEFETDQEYRLKQDEQLGGHDDRRELAEEETAAAPETQPRPMTVVDDGTGFHSKIWSNGAMVPPGDEPEGSGPYLPTWQRSPISGARQSFLNMNWSNAKVIGPGLLKAMIQEKKAVLRGAAAPIPAMKEQLYANLAISQYRENVDDYIDGLSTFLAYPVFDKFGDDQQLAGVLATNIYWKILFSHLLPSSSQGIICVVENSFNQTFAYRLDGPVATYLGEGDPHDRKYDNMEYSENVNNYLQTRATPKNRAYTTVAISDNTRYTIRVFPSQDTEDQFVTNAPLVYTLVCVFGFALASFLFLLFSYVVEKRQHVMIAKVVENAERVASTERELNEFLAHEVRNPVAAAISASSFVCSALNEDRPLSDPETRNCVREDMEVVNSSLNFINDFLRSMLDIHRANGRKLTVHKAPADVLQDILEPVSAILHKRVAGYKVHVDCPENMVVQTDSIRLKQVVLNLVRNSSKFVERGFIRMRADVVDNQVRIYVEDSGPGIPIEKREELFSKYQLSLDVLSQGTGLGLNLCKKLMTSLEGDIWYDESYHSGIDGCPGSRFVLHLNTMPIDIETTITIQTDSESDHQCSTRSNIPSKVENGVCTKSDPPQTPMALFSLPPASNPLNLPPRGPSLQFDEEAPPPPPPATPSVPATDGSTSTSTKPATVPQSTADNNSVPASEGAEIELPDGISCLFVDDDAVLRKLFMRAVKRVAPSWNVQEASSGEMALKICEDNEFSLIFLDQYMASAEKSLLGTETAQAMRAKGIRSVICGLSANDIKDSFLTAGADDFLLKPMPCKPDALRETLLNILRIVEDREETA